MKNKLTPQDFVAFFQEKPSFDKSDLDSSKLYCWPSTKCGLYSISDIYKYFDAKGFGQKEVDDIMWKYIQTQDSPSNLRKMDKGKLYNIFTIRAKNFNPDYSREPYFTYYYYDISIETAKRLVLEYEEDSKISMIGANIKRKSARNISISKANKKNKTISPRTKTPALSTI